MKEIQKFFETAKKAFETEKLFLMLSIFQKIVVLLHFASSVISTEAKRNGDLSEAKAFATGE